MKKHFLITILCLIPFLAFSQKKSIDGFLDIPFGSDSATVKAAIISKGGLKIDSLSNKEKMIFSGLTVSNRKVNQCVVRFVDNKAFEADFYFVDFEDSQSLIYYDSFATDITAVYGKGTLSNNLGNASNTQRIRRLKSGNAVAKTLWQSKNKNTLELAIEPTQNNQAIQIELTYQSTDLVELALSKVRSDL